MREWTGGSTGGALGGLVRLAMEELTFLAGLSDLSRIGVFSQVIQRMLGAHLLVGPTGWLWAIRWHRVFMGLFGIVFALLVEERVVWYGLRLGLLLWLAMNLVLPPLGSFPAVWQVGPGTAAVSLWADLAFGLVLAAVVLSYGRNTLTA